MQNLLSLKRRFVWWMAELLNGLFPIDLRKVTMVVVVCLLLPGTLGAQERNFLSLEGDITLLTTRLQSLEVAVETNTEAVNVNSEKLEKLEKVVDAWLAEKQAEKLSEAAKVYKTVSGSKSNGSSGGSSGMFSQNKVQLPVKVEQLSKTSRNHWTHPGTIENHLKYDHGVDPVNMTREQMLDLHDSIHEGSGPVQPPSQTQYRTPSYQDCPGGRCPTNSYQSVGPLRRLLGR